MTSQLVDRALAIRRRDDVVILEAPAELALDSWIVFDDQQLTGGIRHRPMLPQKARELKRSDSHSRAIERRDLPNHVLALLGRKLRVDRERQNLRRGRERMREVLGRVFEVSKTLLGM